MVGGHAAVVLLEADFLRGLSALLLGGGCAALGPVGIGEHAEAVDGEPWRHEDVVDAAVGLEDGHAIL